MWIVILTTLRLDVSMAYAKRVRSSPESAACSCAMWSMLSDQPLGFSSLLVAGNGRTNDIRVFEIQEEEEGGGKEIV